MFPDAKIAQACLSATIEYRSQHDVNDRLGAADAANLYRFMQRRGAISGRAAPAPALKAKASPIAGMDVGYSPRSGILVYRVEAGAKVRKGQTVCEIIDPADERGAAARTPVAAGTDGVLFARRLDGTLAWPGKVLFRVAGAKALAHRAGMSGLDD
jgi:predicted deacylase